MGHKDGGEVGSLGQVEGWERGDLRVGGKGCIEYEQVGGFGRGQERTEQSEEEYGVRYGMQ